MDYSKPPLSLDDQIELLAQRGMEFSDRARARHCLSHINYYRIRGYWLPFEEPARNGEHRFRNGTRFEDALSLYVFDRHLRLLLMDVIERVEVSLRTQWAYVLAMRHGAHCFLDVSLFRSVENFHRCLDTLQEEVDRSHETFIEHYRRNYERPKLPPIWAACEVMSLGQLSRWMGNLAHRRDRQVIADTYRLDESVLCSFLHHLTHVRNLCAHHSRIWNRRLTFTMKLPNHPATIRSSFNPRRDRNIYNTLAMLAHLMRTVSPDSGWRTELVNLLTKHPLADPSSMGFPPEWRRLHVWN